MAIRTKSLSERLSVVLPNGHHQFQSARGFWHALGREWQADTVLDIVVEDDALTDGIVAALDAEDPIRMLVLTDAAQEAGVSEELCALTRAGIRHFHGV